MHGTHPTSWDAVRPWCRGDERLRREWRRRRGVTLAAPDVMTLQRQKEETLLLASSWLRVTETDLEKPETAGCSAWATKLSEHRGPYPGQDSRCPVGPACWIGAPDTREGNQMISKKSTRAGKNKGLTLPGWKKRGYLPPGSWLEGAGQINVGRALQAHVEEDPQSSISSFCGAHKECWMA